jgi:hypothetical protein
MSKLKGDLAPSTNKTPYELRLELLHLAQHIAERNAENKMALLHLQSEKGSLPSCTLNTVTEDVDGVLMIAKKLNNFISKG